MALDQNRTHSPALSELESFDQKMGSQTSAVIESGFLKPLGDSQETQNIPSESHEGGGDYEIDVLNQPPKLIDTPFISRPLPEDPMDFQDGFQFSKAPAPKVLPIQLNAPRNGVCGQNALNNGGTAQTRNKSHDSACQPGDHPLHDRIDINEAGTQNGDLLLKEMAKKRGVVSSSGGSHTARTIYMNDQHEKQDHGPSQDDLLSGLPFQNTSPLYKSFPSHKAHPRSPVTHSLDTYKLPKTFSDIQRKALIQSNSMHHPIQSIQHSKPRADELSPSKLDQPESYRDLPNAHMVSHPRTRQYPDQCTRHPVINQPLHTPETRTPDTVGRSQKYSSKADKMTRPFSQDTRKDHTINKRPISQASNISKPRASLARENIHTLRKESSPALEESYALRHKLGRAWNKFFVNEDRRNEHWRYKLGCMEEQLAGRDDKIADYLAKIQQQDQAIMDLRTKNEEQDALYQKEKGSSAEMEKRLQRLKGKLKEYKDHLNNVTKEQQNIFKYFQPRYQEMREQLRQDELRNQSSLEQAISSSNMIRDKIQKSVQEVQTLSQNEIQKLNLEIEALHVKLGEREKDVEREKDCVSDLRQELTASREINSQALKSLSTQNQELIEKSDEKAIHIQNLGQSTIQQEQGIQSLIKLMGNSEKNGPDYSTLFESLKAQQTEILGSALSEFRECVTSNHKLSFKAAEDLKTDISAVRESCTDICKQIQIRQDASAWQARFTEAQMDNQALFQEATHLKEELSQMQDNAKMYLEQHESLQQELATLRTGAQTAEKLSNRVDSLRKTKEKLQESLNEKEMVIRSLEDKLKESEVAISDQNHKFMDKERQLHSEREKHTLAVANHHEQQEQAVERARTEESARTRVEYREIEKRLQDTMQNYSQLQKELIEVKQGAKKALKTQEDEAARHVREILKPIASRMDAVTDGLQAFEQAKHDLVANLEAWSNDHVDLSLLQQAVEKLTKERQEVIDDGKLLGELLDVQKKLDDTWKFHKSEADALQRAIDLEKSVKVEREKISRRAHKSKQALDISHVVNRRVTIKSPGTDNAGNEDVIPLSIEEERVTRRQAASPAGIMKPAIIPDEKLTGEQHRKTATVAPEIARGPSKRRITNSNAEFALVSHSVYNRPVLGTSARVEDRTGGRISECTGTASTEMPLVPKKRRRDVDGKRQVTEEHPAKISRSMSNYFHDVVPKEPTTVLIQPTGGAIERRPHSFVTCESSAFGMGEARSASLISATLSETPRIPSSESREPHAPLIDFGS